MSGGGAKTQAGEERKRNKPTLPLTSLFRTSTTTTTYWGSYGGTIREAGSPGLETPAREVPRLLKLAFNSWRERVFSARTGGETLEEQDVSGKNEKVILKPVFLNQSGPNVTWERTTGRGGEGKNRKNRADLAKYS